MGVSGTIRSGMLQLMNPDDTGFFYLITNSTHESKALSKCPTGVVTVLIECYMAVACVYRGAMRSVDKHEPGEVLKRLRFQSHFSTAKYTF